LRAQQLLWIESPRNSSWWQARPRRENSSLDLLAVTKRPAVVVSESNSHSVAVDWVRVTSRRTKPPRKWVQVATQPESSLQRARKPVVLVFVK